MRLQGSGHRRGSARRGYTLMLVLAAMVLIAGAVAVMGSLFAHEVRRTRGVRAEAQLRQILLASVPAARAELAAHGDGTRDVKLTPPVDGIEWTLHIERTANGAAQVHVLAAYRGFKASQRVNFSHGQGADWKVEDVKLEQSGGE